jgi:hypothetical protein
MSVTSQYLITKSDHAIRTISKFSSYLQEGFLCDVVFICNNGQIRQRIVAHRLIVSILSDYFRLMFENNLQTEINLNNIDPDIFQKIILYAYEGKLYLRQLFIFIQIGHLEIHSNNVTNILNAAHRFQITEIVEICSKFIKQQLQPSNCLGLYRIALEHDLKDLIETIWNYILVCL